MTQPHIIGISGTFAAGKDTISHELESRFGYHHISTSDLVRRIAKERHGSIERPVLYNTARELRAEEGAGALVIEAIKSEKLPLVVTGLRSLGEAKEIKKAGGLLVFVDAPLELRYERMRSRFRDDEIHLTLDEFRHNEEKELYAGPDDADFNLSGIKAMADVQIDSSRELKDFIDDALKALRLTD